MFPNVFRGPLQSIATRADRTINVRCRSRYVSGAASQDDAEENETLRDLLRAQALRARTNGYMQQDDSPELATVRP